MHQAPRGAVTPAKHVRGVRFAVALSRSIAARRRAPLSTMGRPPHTSISSRRRRCEREPCGEIGPRAPLCGHDDGVPALPDGIPGLPPFSPYFDVRFVGPARPGGASPRDDHLALGREGHTEEVRDLGSPKGALIGPCRQRLALL